MNKYLVLIPLFLLAPLCSAQTVEDTPASLSVRWFWRQYQDGSKRTHSLPGPNLQLSIPIASRVRLETAFDTGSNAGNSISNVDLGVAYRLGDLDPTSQDPLNNLHVAMTWSMFNSSVATAGAPLELRDEGLGLGVIRLASPQQEFSYYYRLMIHPSLGAHSRNLLGAQALLAEGGMSWRLDESWLVELGYRYRSHKHNGAEDARLSKECGPTLGFRVNF